MTSLKHKKTALKHTWFVASKFTAGINIRINAFLANIVINLIKKNSTTLS